MNTPHVVILGAGLSGLIAAQTLSHSGIKVSVVDKGRAPGGRLASRRIRCDDHTGTFDYGAQSFTIRAEEFKSMTDDWMDQGIIDAWGDGFYNGSGIFKLTDEPRFKGVHSMRSIVMYLAQDVTIFNQCRIEYVQRDGRCWLLASDNGKKFKADILLLTAPIPQSLELLSKQDIKLQKTSMDALRMVQYNPTFTVMALLEKESDIPHPGGLWLNGDILSWIADNTKKGVSPDAHAITMHADEEYSRQRFEMDRDRVGKEILQVAAPYLSARVITHQVHRWKFATPTVTCGEPFYKDESLSLWMAGDSFGGVRMENAALSGLKAAESILEWFRV